MDTTAIPKVFISYNHKDQEVALKIKNKLESSGIKVTIDSVALTTGGNIPEFIKRSIKETDITLLLVSKNSLMSGWVTTETILSAFSETLLGRSFFPCYIENEFFDDDFVDNAFDIIDERLEKIDQRLKTRLDKKQGFADLTAKQERLVKLRAELPSIIGRLESSFCVDLIDDRFDSGMEKVIKDILSKKHVTTETNRLQSAETLRSLADTEVSVRKGEKSPIVLLILQLLDNDQIYEALEEANKIPFEGDQKTTYIRKRKAFSAGLKGQDLIDWIQEMKVFLSQY